MRLGGGAGPLVVSSSSTGGESSSLEWESPAHGWHDLKKSKYKMALRNRHVQIGTSMTFSTNPGLCWRKMAVLRDGCVLILEQRRARADIERQDKVTESCFR